MSLANDLTLGENHTYELIRTDSGNGSLRRRSDSAADEAITMVIKHQVNGKGLAASDVHSVSTLWRYQGTISGLEKVAKVTTTITIPREDASDMKSLLADHFGVFIVDEFALQDLTGLEGINKSEDILKGMS